MKNILVLCTANSCRSIMAEYLIRFYFGDKVNVYSAGVKPAGFVNTHAIKALKEFGIDAKGAKSNNIDELEEKDFDMVVTVCDHANETCPVFDKKVKTIHKGFSDPTGKKFYEYLKILNMIKEELIPIIKKELA